MATAASVDFGGKAGSAQRARAVKQVLHIGPGHATFAGNVDFGGAGLHTARTRGEAAKVCTARTCGEMGPVHDILARLSEANRPAADPFEKWQRQATWVLAARPGLHAAHVR